VDEEATCNWKALLPFRFAVESVDSCDDALKAMVAKWLRAEPEVDVE
jgi:hypothetical protein